MQVTFETARILKIDGQNPAYTSNGYIKMRTARDFGFGIADINQGLRQQLINAELAQDEALGIPDTTIVRGVPNYPHRNALAKFLAMKKLGIRGLSLVNDAVWHLEYPNGEFVWLNKPVDRKGTDILLSEWGRAVESNARVNNVAVSVVGQSGKNGFRMAEFVTNWPTPVINAMENLGALVPSNLQLAGGVNSLQAIDRLSDKAPTSVHSRWLDFDDSGVKSFLQGGVIEFRHQAEQEFGIIPDANVMLLAGAFGLIPAM